jgi:hypothetical protein
MSDHESGPVREERPQGRLDQLLGDGVQAGGGLVQDRDPGVLEDDPSNRQTLLLTPAKAVAALADDGVIPLGQRLDEVVDISRSADALQLLVTRLRAGVEQVVADTGVEQEAVLEDDPDLPAE